MFAIIETGGKQYRVQENDFVFVEKLEANEGDSVVFDKVLMVNDKIGAPYVEGAKVTAKVEAQGRAKKVIVFKYKSICSLKGRSSSFDICHNSSISILK